MPRAKRNETNEAIDVDGLEKLSERYENLERELKNAREDMNELLKEMKLRGYNTKQFKKAMKVKEIGYEEYRMEDEEFHLYLEGVGAIPHREREGVY